MFISWIANYSCINMEQVTPYRAMTKLGLLITECTKAKEKDNDNGKFVFRDLVASTKLGMLKSIFNFWKFLATKIDDTM